MVFALGEFEPGFTRADDFQLRGQARLRFVVELQFARRKERDELRVDLREFRDENRDDMSELKRNISKILGEKP